MAAKLGGVFLTCALGPVNYAGACIQGSKMPLGIQELAADGLWGGVQRGIQQTAKLAGVNPRDVEGLLPMAEIRASLQRVGACQQAALHAWSINAGADVIEKLRLYVAYWDYSLAEENSAGDDDLGSEIDLIATYKYSNNVSIEAGASRFMPDDATATSPDDAADWAYLQITANF